MVIHRKLEHGWKDPDHDDPYKDFFAKDLTHGEERREDYAKYIVFKILLVLFLIYGILTPRWHSWPVKIPLIFRNGAVFEYGMNKVTVKTDCDWHDMSSREQRQMIEERTKELLKEREEEKRRKKEEESTKNSFIEQNSFIKKNQRDLQVGYEGSLIEIHSSKNEITVSSKTVSSTLSSKKNEAGTKNNWDLNNEEEIFEEINNGEKPNRRVLVVDQDSPENEAQAVSTEAISNGNVKAVSMLDLSSDTSVTSNRNFQGSMRGLSEFSRLKQDITKGKRSSKKNDNNKDTINSLNDIVSPSTLFETGEIIHKRDTGANPNGNPEALVNQQLVEELDPFHDSDSVSALEKLSIVANLLKEVHSSSTAVGTTSTEFPSGKLQHDGGNSRNMKEESGVLGPFSRSSSLLRELVLEIKKDVQSGSTTDLDAELRKIEKNRLVKSEIQSSALVEIQDKNQLQIRQNVRQNQASNGDDIHKYEKWYEKPTKYIKRTLEYICIFFADLDGTDLLDFGYVLKMLPVGLAEWIHFYVLAALCVGILAQALIFFGLAFQFIGTIFLLVYWRKNPDSQKRTHGLKTFMIGAILPCVGVIVYCIGTPSIPRVIELLAFDVGFGPIVLIAGMTDSVIEETTLVKDLTGLAMLSCVVTILDTFWAIKICLTFPIHPKEKLKRTIKMQQAQFDDMMDDYGSSGEDHVGNYYEQSGSDRDW